MSGKNPHTTLSPSLRRRISRKKALHLARQQYPELPQAVGLGLAVVQLQGVALRELAKHYKIKPVAEDHWFQLAWCLAIDFVPGMKISQSGSPSKTALPGGLIQALTNATLDGQTIAGAARAFANGLGLKGAKAKSTARTLSRQWNTLMQSGGIASEFAANGNSNYKWRRVGKKPHP